MQTPRSDILAGWRSFRSWKKRFWLSTRRGRGLEPRVARDVIYLADHNQISSLELEGDVQLTCDEEHARDQKIAFMEAYLAAVALDSRNFAEQTRHLLNLQSRRRAPNVLGLWLWQSDPAKFGAGVSSTFQGDSVSIFVESVDQIDFADASAVLPFDQIIVRHPKARWKQHASQKLADRIIWDLACDGIKTKIKFNFSSEFLYLTIKSPDRGML